MEGHNTVTVRWMKGRALCCLQEREVYCPGPQEGGGGGGLHQGRVAASWKCRSWFIFSNCGESSWASQAFWGLPNSDILRRLGPRYRPSLFDTTGPWGSLGVSLVALGSGGLLRKWWEWCLANFLEKKKNEIESC